MTPEVQLLPWVPSTLSNLLELDVFEVQIANRPWRCDEKPAGLTKWGWAILLLKRKIDSGYHLPAIALHPRPILRQESAVDINRFVITLCHKSNCLQRKNISSTCSNKQCCRSARILKRQGSDGSIRDLVPDHQGRPPVKASAGAEYEQDAENEQK